MRFVLALLLILSAAVQSLAVDWLIYGNARFGYRMEVPPGLEWGREADNGDGISLRAGTTRLAIYGAYDVGADFEAMARAARDALTADGWALSYEAVTPSWASFSGTMGARILYKRLTRLCESTAYAGFDLVYSRVDRAEVDPAVDRMVRSLRPDPAC
jgi:hypothetical protein